LSSIVTNFIINVSGFVNSLLAEKHLHLYWKELSLLFYERKPHMVQKL